MKKSAEKSQDLEVLRDEIKVASVEWEEIIVNCEGEKEINQSNCKKHENDCSTCQKVFYLKLARFGDNTNSEWLKIINEIVASKSKIDPKKNLGLIFDVRNNPGGYLTGSVFIASEFIDDGTVVIQENADGSKKTYKVNRQGKLTDIRMVVLINKGSASASEIVAGSLKVRKHIPLVGETSFGKGTIQEAQDLRDGAGIHITTAKWLTPSGRWIHQIGLTPDIKVELTDEQLKAEVADKTKDFQLEKALEEIDNQ